MEADYPKLVVKAQGGDLPLDHENGKRTRPGGFLITDLFPERVG